MYSKDISLWASNEYTNIIKNSVFTNSFFDYILLNSICFSHGFSSLCYFMKAFSDTVDLSIVNIVEEIFLIPTILLKKHS